VPLNLRNHAAHLSRRDLPKAIESDHERSLRPSRALTVPWRDSRIAIGRVHHEMVAKVTASFGKGVRSIRSTPHLARFGLSLAVIFPVAQLANVICCGFLEGWVATARASHARRNIWLGHSSYDERVCLTP
jgi:hypothetical protein